MVIPPPFVAALLLLLAAASSGAQEAGIAAAPVPQIVTGVIDGDTAWNGAVLVRGKVQVRAGTTLTIAPGTEVRFGASPARPDAGEDRLFVQAGGTLIARGTEAQPIVFASATPGVRWFGIELHSGHDRDVFAHCRLRDARTGIACVATSPVIEHTVFEDNLQGVGLWRQAKAIVRKCTFVGNGVALAVSMQSALTLTSSRIEGSEEVGVRVDAGSFGVVEKTHFQGNQVGIQKRGPGRFLTAHNRFEANAVAVSIDHEGAVPELRENAFAGNQRGIVVETKASPRIEGNTFTASETAIHFDGRSKGAVTHNDFTGNRVALRLSRTSAPEVAWNDFSQNTTAVLCEYSSYPIIANNNFRGNAISVHAGDHQSFEWTQGIWKAEEWEGWAKSYGRDRIVARDNYWGEETTRAMENGAPPIGSIFDVRTSRDIEAGGKTYRRDEVSFRPFRPAPLPGAGAAKNLPIP